MPNGRANLDIEQEKGRPCDRSVDGRCRSGLRCFFEGKRAEAVACRAQRELEP